MDATPRKPDPARANGQDAILVLCDTYDTEAFWAAERLCGRGRRVDVVTASALDAVTRWEHRVGEHGTSIEAELPDGRRVSGRERQPILNRLFYAPTERLNRIGGADRDYAAQEMQALFLSWLHAMPGPMLNRPTPQGLGGNLRHPSAWTALAARAGLPVLPWKQSCETDPDAA